VATCRPAGQYPFQQAACCSLVPFGRIRHRYGVDRSATRASSILPTGASERVRVVNNGQQEDTTSVSPGRAHADLVSTLLVYQSVPRHQRPKE
jgi:hypothetical protein